MKRTLNIYIIHATWLKDRQKNIDAFKKIINDYKFQNISNINFKIIEEYDPDDIIKMDVSKFINYSKLEDDNKFNMFLKNLHLFQLSNSLKHYKALCSIKDNSNDNDVNLIIEDDLLYEDKICIMLDRLIEKNEKDILFLGFPSNVKDKKNYCQKVYDVFPNGLPYNDSYLINKSTAEKLSNVYLPIKFLNNIQLTYLLDKLKIEPYLSIPNLFIDGTKFGNHLSVLNSNNILIFNNEYMSARQSLNIDNILSNDSMPEYDFSKETPLKDHPEYMNLKGVYLTKIGKYEEAIDLYKKILNIYRSNNCIINNESEFLKNHTRIYKFLKYDHYSSS